MNFLNDVAVFLAAAVVAVPLFKRLGLGSVLGYLAAGASSAPGARGSSATWRTSSTSPSSAWCCCCSSSAWSCSPRGCGSCAGPCSAWAARRWWCSGAAARGARACVLGPDGSRAAIIAGLGLSLSSTAFALQLLGEKNELDHRARPGLLRHPAVPGPGRRSRCWRCCPCSASPDAPSTRADGWLVPRSRSAGVLVAVVLAGRYVLRPVFRFVASLAQPGALHRHRAAAGAWAPRR